jgi:hypothetical protein
MKGHYEDSKVFKTFFTLLGVIMAGTIIYFICQQ